MINSFNNIYRGKKVLITGHTGFKGSWLSLWLRELGADIVGYALAPATQPNHFELLDLDMVSVIDDIRHQESLAAVFAQHRPEMVFHMAAQSLVRYSYPHPAETFETNVMGTVHVLEAVRRCASVKAIVNVTSDKCYDNKEWVWGYRETDPLGGYDPYSASKGCAEIVTNAYRNSFFPLHRYGEEHHVLLASVRAGNVIGGGDWAEDRLVPDIMRAVADHKQAVIRNPQATRPWQHVLDPLSGYLLLGQQLLEGRKEFAEAWNFGPADDAVLTVEDVVLAARSSWDRISLKMNGPEEQPHEAHDLKLDCSKAHRKLQWQGLWETSRAIQQTVEWYRAYFEDKTILSREQLKSYMNSGRQKKAVWGE